MMRRALCGWIEGMLPGFEAGGLPEWRMRVVAVHLGGCAACRARHDAQVRLAEGLRGDVPRALDFDAFWAAIEPELIRASSLENTAPRRGPWMVAGSAVAATGMLWIGLSMRAPEPIVANAPSPRPAFPLPMATGPIRRPPHSVHSAFPPVRVARAAPDTVRDPFAKEIDRGARTDHPIPLPSAVRADLRSMIRESRVATPPSFPVSSENVAIVAEGTPSSEPGGMPSPVPDARAMEAVVPASSGIDPVSRAYDAPEQAALRTVAVRDLFR